MAKAKTIDMGESFDECCGVTAKKGGKKSKPPKYYPSLSVPDNLGAGAVGKAVKVQLDGRVVGVREETRDGKPTRRRTEIEVRSVTIGDKAPNPQKQSPSGRARSSGLSDYSSHRKAESRAGG